MPSFTAYVAGPVIRPLPPLIVQSPFPYDSLVAAAKNHGVQLTLPTYSEYLDGLPPVEFAREIREQIHRADAAIAMVVAPRGPHDLSGYSIAVEAHEAALAKKPIAILVGDEKLSPPRLLTGYDRIRVYFSFDPETLNMLFHNLASDLKS